MSFMKTLAKVAIGVMIAKGVKGALSKKSAGTAGGGSVFGGPSSRTSSRKSGGGLDGIMDDVIGGGSRTSSRRTGGTPFEDELGGFGGSSGSGRGGGGFGDLLDSFGTGKSGRGLDEAIGGLGTPKSGGGGLGLDDLLGGILGGALGGAAGGAIAGGRKPADPRDAAMQQGTKGFGESMNEVFTKGDAADISPTPQQDAAAALLLRAMIQAAKSDGRIDETEKERILSNLGDASAEETAFVKQELAAQIDIAGLARQTPPELAAQVYGVSVMAIELDQKREAQYLHALAEALGIDRGLSNQIHEKLGAPALYS
jgi:uncharacterized membrane protein YebE (DUF533 family)